MGNNEQLLHKPSTCPQSPKTGALVEVVCDNILEKLHARYKIWKAHLFASGNQQQISTWHLWCAVWHYLECHFHLHNMSALEIPRRECQIFPTVDGASRLMHVFYVLGWTRVSLLQVKKCNLMFAENPPLDLHNHDIFNCDMQIKHWLTFHFSECSGIWFFLVNKVNT